MATPTTSHCDGHGDYVFGYRGYVVRHWRPADRASAAEVIKRCVEEYGFDFEPHGADKDALEVEEFYHKEGRGEFWVAVDNVTRKLVGTAGWYELKNKHGRVREESKPRVEIRRLNLASEARGRKLGCRILQVYLCLSVSVLFSLSKKI